MKKLIYFICFAAVVASCKKADPTPITITKAEVQNSFAVNKQVSGYAVAAGGFSIPSPGENQTYDYSNITQGAALSYKPLAASNTNFPTATYSDTLRNSIGIGSGSANVLETRYFEITDNEWKHVGSIANSVPTTNIPGVGTISYANPLIMRDNPGFAYAKFPLTYNKIFSANSVSTLPFSVNSALVAPFPVPGETRDSTTCTKTVMGWGKIKLKAYSGEMECLMMKTDAIVKRYYMLTNASGVLAPAPAALLSTVGLTDGATVTTLANYEIWVKGKGIVCYINSNGSGSVYTGL